jgi:hypothetical protein
MLRRDAAVESQFEHEKVQQAAASPRLHLQHCLNFILHLEISVFFSKRSGSTAELLSPFVVIMMGPSQTNF